MVSQLAIEKLNANKILLQGSAMTYMLHNSAVSTTEAASLAFSLIENNAVGIIAAEQTSISAVVASIAQAWNVMYLSFKSIDERRLNRKTLPLVGTVSIRKSSYWGLSD